MRSVLRLLLLAFVVAGFLAPALPDARADTPAPCPSQTAVVKECRIDGASLVAPPRAAPAADAPCHGKAIETAACDLARGREASALRYENGSPRWSRWAPLLIDPPPRSAAT